jgi:hypothetical protein
VYQLVNVWLFKRSQIDFKIPTEIKRSGFLFRKLNSTKKRESKKLRQNGKKKEGNKILKIKNNGRNKNTS